MFFSNPATQLFQLITPLLGKFGNFASGTVRIDRQKEWKRERERVETCWNLWEGHRMTLYQAKHQIRWSSKNVTQQTATNKETRYYKKITGILTNLDLRLEVGKFQQCISPSLPSWWKKQTQNNLKIIPNCQLDLVGSFKIDLKHLLYFFTLEVTFQLKHSTIETNHYHYQWKCFPNLLAPALIVVYQLCMSLCACVCSLGHLNF